MSEGLIHTLTAEFFQDPHIVYRKLNEDGPVHRIEFPNGIRAWLVTGYDLAKQVLTDPTISKDLYGPAGYAAQTKNNVALRLDPPVNDHLVYSDPPRHTRLRSIIMKAFAGKAIRDFTPTLQNIAETLLDTLSDETSVDLLRGYAYPFAATVICELIGIAASDRREFQGWLTTQVSTADVAEKHAAAEKFESYVHRLIDDRPRDEGQDFLSELIAPTDDGHRLDRRELVAMINALLLGSQETIAGLIGNAVLTMLRTPGLRDELSATPDLVPAFLEETMRYEGSGNITTYRFITEPIRLGSQHIESGEIILVSLASANRDRNHFSHADEFDLHRSDNRHLAFGYGIHRCAAASLARREAQIAIAALLARYPRIALATAPEELKWQSSLINRSLVSLPVRLHES
ncbi:cytochrome P450 family protein [Nocardia niwae]|uniref:Cytochrome P450 n=1 Tax=Nocardia niwae TaxID=626084 RepID=A0ABV2X6Y4_9NOCA